MKHMKKIMVISFLLFASAWVSAQKAPSHQLWDQLLKKYVNTQGRVDYTRLQKNKGELDAYLKVLSEHPPQNTWTQNEEKAFWINAYNAFTVSLILQHYPIKSIKDIGDKIKIPFINTPWDIRFIQIGGKKYDLNNIEHGILRKKYNDPRIHFAIVCASLSCPKLRNEAYTGAQLDNQLEEAGKTFLNDPFKNKIGADQSEVSKYFSWYKGDFTKKGSLADFINKYSVVKINSATRISYLDYNWSLNDQK